eukprot:UC1_evm2s429
MLPAIIRKNPVCRIYFFVIFLFSGLVVNFCQLLTALVIWPLSRNLYRTVNSVLVEWYWTELMFLLEHWSEIRLRLFAKDEATLDKLGKVNCVLLSNHKSDADWLFGWLMAQHTGCLGGTKCLMKKALSYVPVLGWSWYFLEYIFVARSWIKDREHITKCIRQLGTFPHVFWMVIFAEGTRFTREKYEASASYCREKGLRVFKNVLLPRTKGFVVAMDEMRHHIDNVTVTTAILPDNKVVSLGAVLDGMKTEVHVHLDMLPASEVPVEDADVSQYCVDRYGDMDDLLEYHKEHNTFPGVSRRFEPLRKPVIVMVFWALLLTLLLAYKMTQSAAWFYGIPGALIALGLLVEYGINWAVNQHSSVKLKTSAKEKAT